MTVPFETDAVPVVRVPPKVTSMGIPMLPPPSAAERGGLDGTRGIALGKHGGVLRAGVQVYDEHVQIGKRLRVLFLDAEVPDFLLRRVSGVQLAGFEGLRLRRLFQRGVHLAEDVGFRFLAPVVFGAGILHALSDGRPDGRTALACVQIQD